MKRLSLNELQLESNEILRRDQLLSIGGGDCFDQAISDLQSMEASIGNGVSFSDAEATYWLNINYAACVCTGNIASIELYDACWG